MSNYTKATNFASKDTLPVGDANKKVKGSEIDTEFNAISDSIATKADKDSPTFTGTPLSTTATAGTNTTQIATTAFVKTAVDNKFPVVTADLGADSVTGAKIADDSIDSEHYVDGSIDTAHIADDAVTTAKLATTGVTAGTYGSSSAIPAITVNAEGQVTSATTSALSQPTFSITTSSATFGNDTTINVPSNCVMVSGTARFYGGSSNGARLSAQLKTSSDTVIDTIILGGFNETAGTDGGSGMYSRDAFTFFVPSNCAKVRFYRSAGSNSISGEVSQFLIYS